MYTELIQRCKQVYLTESDTEDDSFYQLPSFLDSIASVMIHLDKVERKNMRSITVLLFVDSLLERFCDTLLFCVFRFQRCIHPYWSASWWCRLTAFHSTVRECRVLVAGPY